MAHVRQQIVEKFEEILTPVFGEDRVIKSLYPHDAHPDGMVQVLIVNEDVDRGDLDVQTPVYNSRSLFVGVAIIVANAEQTNRFLAQDLSVMVEEAVAAEDPRFDGLVEWTSLEGYSQELTHDDRETLVGTLIYRVDYVTESTDVTRNNFYGD